MQPKTELFKEQVKLDEYGYIISDEDMQTDIPGVFAAGDVRKKKVRQIATAVGEGATAGIMAEKFINGR
jgi:thioredoxin reductase (NADPH)